MMNPPYCVCGHHLQAHHEFGSWCDVCDDCHEYRPEEPPADIPGQESLFDDITPE